IDIINILNEEDKIIYANNSRFLDVRKKLIFCLREKMNYKIVYSNIEKINYIEELNLIIDEISIKNTLSDRNMYKLMQKTYEKCYYNDFSSSYDLFNSFTSDILENMENVMKHMARITLADKAILVIENSNGENNIICTYRLSDKKETDRYFSLKLESEEDVIVVSNNHNRLDHLNDEVLKHGIKSCIYMKLRNKDKSINSESSVNGQLILIATNAVNYINSESKKKIEKFKPFLTFLLEKYKLTISSTLDKLTSVYNRKYFEESLVYLLEKSSFNNSEFAVIMFDIDDFKGVNDKYGHQVGDEVLIKLTKEVKRSIGRSDIIGRYGGEEFVVLLPSVDKLKAINMAEKIRNNVEDARILGDKRKVTISIGIAMSGHERINSEEIVNRADQALYMAKHEGKNRYVLWDGEKIISKNTNTNNELSGILSGNSAKDYNFISIIKDVAVIVKSKNSKENKMYEFVLKIMQIIECDSVTLFIIDNNTIINIMSKDRLKDGWNVSEKFNFKLVYQTIENKKGMYKVDWDNIGKQDKYGIPDWKSVCIVPVVCNEEVIALIYLSVSVNKKEFTVIDLNKLNFFADMGIPIFE
ncbi:MAG: GGDEF domain-containing protein, partial [Clostridium sp.]|nr:GGDEF domain-containing protein [Clostridium sp.]